VWRQVRLRCPIGKRGPRLAGRLVDRIGILPPIQGLLQMLHCLFAFAHLVVSKRRLVVCRRVAREDLKYVLERCHGLLVLSKPTVAATDVDVPRDPVGIELEVLVIELDVNYFLLHLVTLLECSGGRIRCGMTLNPCLI
jgi:hypothetical protein